MDEELRVFLAGMEARLDERIRTIEQRVNARIDKLETSLLTKIHRRASPVECKLRTHRSWLHEIDAEIELLKERIGKLEGGKAS